MDKIEDLESIFTRRGKKFLINVETAHDPDVYNKFEYLRYLIWGDPDDHLATLRNLVSENYFNDGSSLFIGVYVEDEKGGFTQDEKHLVGFSYGFFGVKDKKTGYRDPGNHYFYSQYIGARGDFQKYGLGVIIKGFQKRILSEVLGVFLITCTYDPLTGINAYRNIHCFGMDVVDYLDAHYKDFAGNLNRTDVSSDRFFVFWDLKKEKSRPEYDLDFLLDSGCLAISSEQIEIKGKYGSAVTEVVKDINFDIKKKQVLVEIPYDFYAMLDITDVPDKKVRNIPFEWRIHSRRIFHELFSRGYQILDFKMKKMDNRKRDFYVLSRMP